MGGIFGGQLSQLHNLAGLSGLGQAQQSPGLGGSYQQSYMNHQMALANEQKYLSAVLPIHRMTLHEELQNDLDEYLKGWDK